MNNQFLSSLIQAGAGAYGAPSGTQPMPVNSSGYSTNMGGFGGNPAFRL
jgi:hypothetical protein